MEDLCKVQDLFRIVSEERERFTDQHATLVSLMDQFSTYFAANKELLYQDFYLPDYLGFYVGKQEERCQKNLEEDRPMTHDEQKQYRTTRWRNHPFIKTKKAGPRTT